MKTKTIHRSCLILFLTALVLISSDPWNPPALADGPPTTKGVEVSTIGTGPYLGPLPEELAKLTQLEATAQTAPLPAKEPATATMTSSSAGNTLTPSELAKLAALQAIVVTLPVPLMTKLKLMQLSKDGSPVLTAQEREKRAKELAPPTVIPETPATPNPILPQAGPGSVR